MLLSLYVLLVIYVQYTLQVDTNFKLDRGTVETRVYLMRFSSETEGCRGYGRCCAFGFLSQRPCCEKREDYGVDRRKLEAEHCTLDMVGNMRSSTHQVQEDVVSVRLDVVGNN